MPPIGPRRLVLDAVQQLAYAFSVVAVLAVGWAEVVHGAEAGPVLNVASARVAQDVDVVLPNRAPASPSNSYRLIECDRPAASLDAVLVPAIEPDGLRSTRCSRLIASIGPRADAGNSRRFRLEPATAAASAGFAWRAIDDKSLGLWDGDRPVLVYNFGTITCDAVPKSDNRRSRACFVYPLYGMSGEVLTDAFPKDHYHHVGLFWAWPHVRIDGQEYDLWTYKNIRQQFVCWLCREVSPLAAVLGVENGWFVGEKKVLTERVWLTIHRAAEDHRAIDVRLVLLPAERPVTLWGAEGKSYGGLNLRYAPSVDELKVRQIATKPKSKTPAAAQPKSPGKGVNISAAAPPAAAKPPQDTFITVAAGVAHDDLPDTRLTWADLVRQFPGAAAPSGAALFVDPRHPDYPPTWLTRHYGILCIGWPGVKPQTLAPCQPTTLDYRVWIHRASLGVDVLKQAYDGYTAACRAEWKEQTP